MEFHTLPFQLQMMTQQRDRGAQCVISNWIEYILFAGEVATSARQSDCSRCDIPFRPQSIIFRSDLVLSDREKQNQSFAENAHLKPVISKPLKNQPRGIAFREILACSVAGFLLFGILGCEGPDKPADTATANSGEKPLMLSSEGAKPKVTITGGKIVEGGAEYDFGSTEVGQEFEHVFHVKNDGDGVLEMTKGSPSCTTCTSFEVDKLKLDPGETATVTVKWKIRTESSEFRQHVPLNTAPPGAPGAVGPDEGVIKLYVTGKVVRRIIISPSERWDFGTLEEGHPLEFTGTVASALLDQFEVTSVKADSPKLSVKSIPLTAERLAELKVKSGFEIQCVLAPNIDVGEFQDKISLDLLNPEKLTLTVDVLAKRSGPMEIFGPNWDAKRMMVRLGSFNAAKDYSQRLNLYTRGFEDELIFESFHSDDPRFSVELVPDQKFKGADKNHRRYDLFIKYKGSNRDAAYSLQKPLELTIQTNQPKIEAISLKTINIKIISQGTLRD